MSRKIEPSLESITVTGKYEIPETDFNYISEKVLEELEFGYWQSLSRVGESIRLIRWQESLGDSEELGEEWEEYLRTLRSGVPVYLSIITVEHHTESILVEVECHPAMWQLIAYSYGEEASFTENEVQEALSECKTFVKLVMSIFKAKEIKPVGVYPIIPKTEIKGRLLNLGLKKLVKKLDTAERHIVQNNFAESLKSNRTAFEKMIDWQMKKRGLKQTNNYKNDLERLRSKGYLDAETTKLLQTYYRCLSNIGVHEKGPEPGIYEAQMGYGMTLIMLKYFADKLP